MKEIDLIEQAISVIDGALPSEVPVRTTGGDEILNTPPYCSVRWDVRRVNDHGARPFAGTVIQPDGSVNVHKHHYFEMTLDVLGVSEDEYESYSICGAVQDAFLPFEDDSAAFDPETYLWEVRSIKPSIQPGMEPDWYEQNCEISFRFLKVSADENVPTIQDIDYTFNQS